MPSSASAASVAENSSVRRMAKRPMGAGFFSGPNRKPGRIAGSSGLSSAMTISGAGLPSGGASIASRLSLLPSFDSSGSASRRRPVAFSGSAPGKSQTSCLRSMPARMPALVRTRDSTSARPRRASVPPPATRIGARRASAMPVGRSPSLTMRPVSQEPRSLAAMKCAPSGSISRPERPPKCSSGEDSTSPPRNSSGPKRVRPVTSKRSMGVAVISIGTACAGAGEGARNGRSSARAASEPRIPVPSLSAGPAACAAPARPAARTGARARPPHAARPGRR